MVEEGCSGHHISERFKLNVKDAIEALLFKRGRHPSRFHLAAAAGALCQLVSLPARPQGQVVDALGFRHLGLSMAHSAHSSTAAPLPWELLSPWGVVYAMHDRNQLDAIADRYEIPRSNLRQLVGLNSNPNANTG